jgi:hypothetical protein
LDEEKSTYAGLAKENGFGSSIIANVAVAQQSCAPAQKSVLLQRLQFCFVL